MGSLGFGGCAVYVAGVALGLILSDAKPLARIGLAVLWPLGPLAFIVTITILFVAALIAYPAFGIAALIVGAAIRWALF